MILIKNILLKSGAFLFVFFIFNISECRPNERIQQPFPIEFAISETKFVSEIPAKDKDFASIIPGDLKTYIYTEESDYYKDYQRSYFAITCKKGGWDCMRHYEILANGCIPYFVDIDKCNPKTMHFLPKELIKEAMHLEGVSYGKIDHKKFNRKRYYEILNKLLEHTRNYLTTKNMAEYVLTSMNYSGTGKVLFLCQNAVEDYMKATILIGLKELLLENVIDFPRVDHIYKDYSGDPKRLYGRGFTYSKVVDDYPVDRSNIEKRIKNKEFEIIIFAYVHYGCMFYDTVLQNYASEKIAYICGEDAHRCQFAHLPNLFLREYDAC